MENTVLTKGCFHTAAHKVQWAALSQQQKERSASFFKLLESILKRASQIGSKGFSCRKCTNCCQQDKRFLQLFAVEVAYMTKELNKRDIPMTDSEEERFCPMLTNLGQCLVYENRPFGCRLFVPWYNWHKDKGCATYPHSRKSLAEINFLLRQLEQLNAEFVLQTNLQLDLDFDFFGHWGVNTWFWQTCCGVS